MDESYIKPVFERFIAGMQSEGDLRALTDYAADPEGNGHLSRLMDAYFAGAPADQTPETQERLAYILADTDRFIRQAVKSPAVATKSTAESESPAVTRELSRWSARAARVLPYAAAAIFALAIGGWLLFGDGWSVSGGRQFATQDIRPGGNRAVLTFADGRVVNLDETQTGITVSDENITYTDGTALAVISSEAEGRPAISQLELTTPKGGTYRITLPDGSNVWLNAGSTLKYPNHFSESERTVELQGEGYFEIKKTREYASFKVRTAGQEVVVLGTQFNLSAYADDPETKTTLVEGKVRLEANGASVQLVPGEQGKTTANGFMKSEVNIDQYTAWKNGDFHFGGDLELAMKQVSRWYDITVEFRDQSLKGAYVSGSVLRSRPLDEVLDLLTRVTGARFELKYIQGERRVVVMR